MMPPDYKQLIVAATTIFVVAVAINLITLISLTLVVIGNHL
jgi:hypothetical protein